MKTKLVIVLFKEYLSPKNFIAEVLPLKVGLKLMADHDNLFEKFLENCQVKFGRLQIPGFSRNYTQCKSVLA